MYASPHWFRVLLVVLIVSAMHPAHAQSFDCSKASTAVEHTICREPAIGELDWQLAEALNNTLLGAPERRPALLADQRRWLKARDQQCPARGEVPTLPAAYRTFVNCLTRMYTERIDELVALVPAPGGPSDSLESCRVLDRRYRALAAAHPGESPLNVLTKTPGSGVEIASPSVGPPVQDAARELVEWGRQQTPPVTIAPAVLKLFIGDQGRVLQRLPDANFYEFSSVQGTAHCYDSYYLKIENGVAVQASTPPGFGDGDIQACGVSRHFGRIDGTPVYAQEDYDGTPNMRSSVTVAAWRGGGFVGACRLDLLYGPHFTEKTVNRESECKGEACADLRAAAFELVEAVQRDPATAYAERRAALSPAQRQGWAAALDIGPGNDPAALTDEHPANIPYIYRGQVLVASLGHDTVGWRLFADWQVIFEESGAQYWQSHALGTFAVGMLKGPLLESHIVPIRPGPATKP